MTRWIVFALLAAILTAGPVHAVAVPVRTGDHADFTRLVLTLPDSETGWRLRKRGQGYRLTLEAEGIEYDLSESFVRISRERLADLRAVGGDRALDLLLNCGCSVRSFRFGDRHLVVDIQDTKGTGTGHEAHVFGFGLPAVDSPTPRAKLRFARAVPRRTPERFPRPSADAAVSANLPTPRGEDWLGNEGFFERQKQVRTARIKLLEGLGKAATQGLLDPVERVGRQVLRVPDTRERQDSTSAPPSPPAESKGGLPNVNMAAQTSIDQAVEQTFDALRTQASDVRCLTSAAVAIQDWADDRSMAAQLADWRGKLYGEFDKPDIASVTGLARLYLHFGFGAEAEQILKLAQAESPRHDVLFAMARMMDHNSVGRVNPFAGQLTCDGGAALWSLLAEETPEAAGNVNVRAVLQAFSVLPAHLRLHLGPRLNERFIARQDVEASQAILKATERGAEAPDARVHMAEAQLDMSTGDMAAAEKNLDKVVASNSELSPAALVDLIESRHEQGESLREDLAALVGAMAIEHRNEPEGADLRMAHVTARAMTSEFAAAFEALSDLENRDGAGNAAQARSRLVDRLTDRAEDFAFAELMLRKVVLPGKSLEASVENAAANRLVALGFPTEARHLIAEGADGDIGSARRMLRARAAILLGKPRQAEADLLGLKGQEANRLRAEARSMAGEHERAAALLASIGETEEAENAAWLAGSWDRLRSAETDVFRNLTRVVSAPEAPQGDLQLASLDEVTLSESRTLLEESIEARETLRNLLAHFKVQVPQTE
ncbi:hypothetical protein SAMN04490248_101257 [Salinihabitans flavidus]|uniref:Tetratricopeptide repeat-containing protein n=1 Tax=Salinihabitans flavidus TaxID=569882 RepID=A0A1H8LR16_9RHOB|nr:hypothetical protein [Salinihabitans flavidus]SEO07587.1 hypothetical protein SAMN04490248_101257 [Salinihabitans flavidus]